MIKQLMILGALALAATPSMATPEEAMTKAGCMACHAKDKKVLGPSFKDIAAKYKGQGDAVPKLMENAKS